MSLCGLCSELHTCIHVFEVYKHGFVRARNRTEVMRALGENVDRIKANPNAPGTHTPRFRTPARVACARSNLYLCAVLFTTQTHTHCTLQTHTVATHLNPPSALSAGKSPDIYFLRIYGRTHTRPMRAHLAPVAQAGQNGSDAYISRTRLPTPFPKPPSISHHRTATPQFTSPSPHLVHRMYVFVCVRRRCRLTSCKYIG